MRKTLHILAAVAENEREMISQRTKAALSAAKERGQRLGFSPHPKEVLEKAVEKSVYSNQGKAHQFAKNILPIIRDIQNAGIVSYKGIAEALNARGVRSARGGRWYAQSVKSVITSSTYN